MFADNLAKYATTETADRAGFTVEWQRGAVTVTAYRFGNGTVAVAATCDDPTVGTRTMSQYGFNEVERTYLIENALDRIVKRVSHDLARNPYSPLANYADELIDWLTGAIE